MTRVAITGAGIVSALGTGCRETLDALRSSRSGIRRLTRVDPERLNCTIGGEVPGVSPDAGMRQFDRFAQLALIAAGEATGMAGDLGLARERVGAIIGTGLGGCETLDSGYDRLYGQNARVPPLTIPMSMYNAATSAVAQRFDARGVAYCVVSACASSAHAIGAAHQAIRSGQADAMLAGGSDAPLTFGTMKAWEALRVLAPADGEPEAACRPFSSDRKGLVLAEGAAVLLLESWENATRRGANILGEVLGSGATSDAGHLTDPSADGAARAMQLALLDARLDPRDVGYINAHGTATRANDPAEAAAIRSLFGPDTPAVSSTKSAHGHAMGASGAIESVCSLLSLRDGFLPATLNLTEPDRACELDHVANTPRESDANVFLCNSFGFGGMNGVVAFRVFR